MSRPASNPSRRSPRHSRFFLPVPVLLAILASCSSAPRVDWLSYRVIYDPGHRYEARVVLTAESLAGKTIVIQRPFQNPSDHRRGFIEWIQPTPIRSLREQSAWKMTVPDDGHIEYIHSFLSSKERPESEFRNSRHDSNGLFLQLVDLFCFPEGITETTRFAVELDGFSDPIVTWASTGNEYHVTPAQLTGSFLFDGTFRRSESQTPFTLFVAQSLPDTLDPLIVRSVEQSMGELTRSFPGLRLRNAMIIVIQTDGFSSRAMRRGDMMVLGLPPTIPFDSEARKRLAHECVHFLGDSEHDVAWFEEGVSEYFAWISLCRSRQISVDEFFEAMAEKIMQVRVAEISPGAPNRTQLVYSYGMLGTFALDVAIRATPGGHRIEDLLNAAFAEGKREPLTRRDIVRYLSEMRVPDASDMFDRIASGELDLLPAIDSAGLKLTETDVTMISDPEPGQPHDRILETDTVISINKQSLERSQWHQYLRDHLNTRVEVEVERDGRRVIQHHRIIAKVRLEISDTSGDAIWSEIIHL